MSDFAEPISKLGNQSVSSIPAAGQGLALDPKRQIPLGVYGIVPVGASVPYAGNTIDETTGFRMKNGDVLKRDDYPELFVIVSTTYNTGGEGSDEFRLPNQQNKFSVMKGSDTEFDTVGETGGAKTHTLTASEIPSLPIVVFSGGGTYIEGTAKVRGAAATGSNDTLTGQVNASGGGNAHSILPPYLTENWIIRVR